MSTISAPLLVLSVASATMLALGAGLWRQWRAPAGIDPGVVQDLPHGGGGDRVAELDDLALHAPVPPGRVVGRDADHELADFGCRGWPAGPPPVRVVPFVGAHPAVPRVLASPVGIIV